MVLGGTKSFLQTTSWVLFLISMAGFIGFAAVIWADTHIHDKTPLYALLLAIVVLVVTERLASILKERDDKALAKHVEDVVGTLPEMIASSGRLLTIPTSRLALQQIQRSHRKITVMRNTVLRFGREFVHFAEQGSATDWHEFKKSTSLSGEVREIVSLALKGDEALASFIANVKALRGPKPALYKLKFLDDHACPMMQMTHIMYDDSSEAIYFGWQYAANEAGPVFYSNEKALTQFFLRYFDHHFSHLAHDATSAAAS